MSTQQQTTNFNNDAAKKRNDFRVVLAQHVVYPRTKIGDKTSYDNNGNKIVTPIYEYHTEDMLPPPRKTFTCEAEYNAWRGFSQHMAAENAYADVDLEEDEGDLEEQNAHLVRD